ncbi:site-specific integrase [Ensifer sp. PDNC004]|uniref:tyrosine-type recombinase/integrase n=1 Tax=Ensifer sp. PDNC004 TaxID=2811423 RepID=UPI001966A95B|nr:site-specific integrase [Ensifer sp. PDNC004]QRY69287.1 site-specific integrase [Ensifer sp. PDNC004]
MSVYKSKASPFYHYDFWFNCHRFHGTTKARNKRDAEAIERQLKEQARRDADQFRRTGKAPMTIDTAVGRYWTEKAQFRADKEEFFGVLERIVLYFGKGKRLDEIDDEAITGLVAHKRKLFRWGKSKLKHAQVKTVSNATINRKTLEPLKAIFRRAKLVWGCSLPHEPHWREHLLKEPNERLRELHQDEQLALDWAMRDDYYRWFLFLHLSGRRLNETLIRWSDVNLQSGEIMTKGKGDFPVWTPIFPSIRKILESCRGHHPEFVFTFIARRTGHGKVAGRRYPITYHGALTEWRRARERSGVKNFRLHDCRHDRASKLLRETRNLKLVQRVLNHHNISTTAKYTNVMDEEVCIALEHSAKSRNQSRKKLGDGAQPTDFA